MDQASLDVDKIIFHRGGHDEGNVDNVLIGWIWVHCCARSVLCELLGASNFKSGDRIPLVTSPWTQSYYGNLYPGTHFAGLAQSLA